MSFAFFPKVTVQVTLIKTFVFLLLCTLFFGHPVLKEDCLSNEIYTASWNHAQWQICTPRHAPVDFDGNDFSNPTITQKRSKLNPNKLWNQLALRNVHRNLLDPLVMLPTFTNEYSPPFNSSVKSMSSIIDYCFVIHRFNCSPLKRCQLKINSLIDHRVW